MACGHHSAPTSTHELRAGRPMALVLLAQYGLNEESVRVLIRATVPLLTTFGFRIAAALRAMARHPLGPHNEM